MRAIANLWSNLNDAQQAQILLILQDTFTVSPLKLAESMREHTTVLRFEETSPETHPNQPTTQPIHLSHPSHSIAPLIKAVACLLEFPQGLGRYDQYDAFLYNVTVIPTYRGLGYGGMLLQRVLDWCHRHSKRRIWLCVKPENTVALQMYQRRGWIYQRTLPNGEWEMLKTEKFP